MSRSPAAIVSPAPLTRAARPLGTAVLLPVLAALAILTAGCNETAPAGEAGRDRPFDIVCTVGMVADIVQQVAGDRGVAVNIIGEGVDPHLYQATSHDVKRLLAADIVFYAGLHLEGKMADALVKVARGGKPVYAVTELVDPAYLLEPKEFAGQYDPHVWMDVRGWMSAVEAVSKALAETDPDHAESYRGNAEAYLVELAALDAYARESIASIPETGRVLITAHDAFNYFGRAYGIEVLGIQGISTESEAGIEKINRLISLIIERDVRAVFVETSVSEKSVRALIEGTRARGGTVVVGGRLFSDAMGAPGTYEGTYIGMIDHNVTTITRALGGTAALRPRAGEASP